MKSLVKSFNQFISKRVNEEYGWEYEEPGELPPFSEGDRVVTPDNEIGVVISIRNNKVVVDIDGRVRYFGVHQLWPAEESGEDYYGSEEDYY